MLFDGVIKGLRNGCSPNSLPTKNLTGLLMAENIITWSIYETELQTKSPPPDGGMFSCPTVLILYMVWFRIHIKAYNSRTGVCIIIKRKAAISMRIITVRVHPKTAGINSRIVNVIRKHKTTAVKARVLGNIKVTIRRLIFFIERF